MTEYFRVGFYVHISRLISVSVAWVLNLGQVLPEHSVAFHDWPWINFFNEANWLVGIKFKSSSYY